MKRIAFGVGFMPWNTSAVTRGQGTRRTMGDPQQPWSDPRGSQCGNLYGQLSPECDCRSACAPHEKSRGHRPRTLKSRRRGATRTEFEYVIPYSDAVEILRTMCDGHVLDKVRHVIIHAGTVWHVDVYEGILDGAVIAEVELPHADQKLDLPGWIGKEVTGDPRYRKINMRTQRIVGLPERPAAAQMTVN
jgi:CYTH domain-containing protein